MSSSARAVTCVVVAVSVTYVLGQAQLLHNGGFDSADGWHCSGFPCELISPGDSRFGAHSLKASNRTQSYMGPSQAVNLKPGTNYLVQSYVKILNDLPNTLGQEVDLQFGFTFEDGTHGNVGGARQPLMTKADGWVLLKGDFHTPGKAFTSATFYFQGPAAGVDFAVDLASITEVDVNADSWRQRTDSVINRVRKSDISFRVTVASTIHPSEVRIQVKQTKKSFPFGSAINSWKYVDPSQQKYQDWIHTHLNWAVLENALKWGHLEPTEGHYSYDVPLRALHSLKNHGLKVRGHNLVWSIASYVPSYVKTQTGDQLRATVRNHIILTCNVTRGLLEHWDVNNENLHGFWFQQQLHDRNYDLEIFRETHAADPQVHLFLNDYGVVGSGATTGAYLNQARRFKAANVGLYGLGAQTHIPRGTEPVPAMIKERLDALAQAGLPIWATEVTVEIEDEHTRADHYERVLRALYGHEAVEGILFWGFWDQAHYAGERAALVRGSDLTLTEAGRRVLDLLENQWMTHESHTLSQASQQFTVRGFHGDYQVSVFYQNRELTGLRQTFTLGKAAHAVTINVHT